MLSGLDPSWAGPASSLLRRGLNNLLCRSIWAPKGAKGGETMICNMQGLVPLQTV